MMSIGRLRKHLERFMLDRTEKKTNQAITKMTRTKFSLEKITFKEKLPK